LNSKPRRETRLNRRPIVSKRVVFVNEKALILLIIPRVVTGPTKGDSGRFWCGDQNINPGVGGSDEEKRKIWNKGGRAGQKNAPSFYWRRLE